MKVPGGMRGVTKSPKKRGVVKVVWNVASMNVRITRVMAEAKMAVMGKMITVEKEKSSSEVFVFGIGTISVRAGIILADEKKTCKGVNNLIL